MVDVEEFLAARRAREMEHPGGTLLTHLWRTHDVLAERATLVELIWAEAESIVYTYGSCDRAFTYPLLAGESPWLRDRFTGEVHELRPRQVRDLVELTFANELDVLAYNEDLRAAHDDALRRLFTAWRRWASGPANVAAARFFG